MNKNVRMTLIVILTILILAIIALFILLLTDKTVLYGSFQNKIIYENKYDNLKDIKISSSSSDLYVKKSDDNEFHIVIYGKDEREVEVTNVDNKLNVKKKNIGCIGFCFYDDRIYLYIPEEYDQTLEINMASGDAILEDDFAFALKVKLASGDINVRKINLFDAQTASGDITVESVNEARIKSASGDIRIERVNYLDLESSSGDVRISNFTINQDSKIETKSGDVTINSIDNCYIETRTSSGDVKISNNDRFAENTLEIKTSSGDIRVKN